MIKEGGCKAGLVFNPATPLYVLENVMDKLDMILLMSVNPGFGGQSFIPQTLEKCRQVRQLIDASGKDIRLEIDGGVKIDNIREVAAAGADTFVAGSAIFNTDDYKATIDAMRAELAKAYGCFCHIVFSYFGLKLPLPLPINPSTERHPDEYVGLRDTLKKIKRPYLWTLNLTFDFLLKI
jgi:hypothetical protein